MYLCKRLLALWPFLGAAGNQQKVLPAAYIQITKRELFFQ
jgi:hypothetical protein